MEKPCFFYPIIRPTLINVRREIAFLEKSVADLSSCLIVPSEISKAKQTLSPTISGKKIHITSIPKSSSANICLMVTDDLITSAIFKLQRNLDANENSSVSAKTSDTSDLNVSQNESEANVISPIISLNSPSKYATSPGEAKKTASNVIVSRKGCNCSKSQCTKLYYECYARAQYCLDCNCSNCHNNLEHSVERSEAIRVTLSKNSSAFLPKIGDLLVSNKTPKPRIRDVVTLGELHVERQHRKGCRCARSNCSKRYCECFQANIPCTSKCRCKSCDNTEEKSKKLLKCTDDDDEFEEQNVFESGEEIPPWLYLKDNVIEAFTQVLCSKVNQMEQNGETDLIQISIALLLEFGNCLNMIFQEA